MAGKRLHEYRLIGDKQVAAAYRKSFRHYEEQHLQTSMFAYATGATILLGAWGGAIVRSVG